MRPLRLPFSRWREKVPEADEGGTTASGFAWPSATLTPARFAGQEPKCPEGHGWPSEAARRPLPPAGEV